MKLAKTAMLAALAATSASAQTNLGAQPPEASLPFVMTQVATFNLPWRLAFLPDGRMLITEKVGPIWLVTQTGEKTPVANAPPVLAQGQGGMLGVFLSPHYAKDHFVYLTYAEPGDGGSSLALARAKLTLAAGSASLDDLKVIWRDGERGKGGQFGAQVAFSPDKKYLFLTVGDRQRMTPAQDPDQPLGKILRLTLDGKPAPGNPMAGKTGAASVPVIDPPKDSEAATTAPVVRTYAFPGPNLTPAETWTSGHRTPYGLAFAPDGKLWEAELGPRGGDELNLIEPGKNYGWPLVSYAVNYDGVPIPNPDARPDLAKPVLYWTPVIDVGNLIFYNGKMFPQWKGSALISGLGTKTLNRVIVSGATAKGAERWNVGFRVRDVEVAPDGALWMLEDNSKGGLYRVTPK
ncbi:PQQ-dependent sugar dehydrogenase [Phenylobacterium hankyongense]|uniref:PQQ-dependent sugar dehydrogenase n=1 Tax=Phenylobacterium hankyongense TaxID=1813876 RepID=A0A328B2Z0_9CAUL|nr:PQQ-dependent sugar dehydrogenase [Phenylobacterium hankyongense]RAK60895.1 PQQ-dependent sugar dehydrogenase [Phenylobacterium hankyongense]